MNWLFGDRNSDFACYDAGYARPSLCHAVHPDYSDFPPRCSEPPGHDMPHMSYPDQWKERVTWED